MTTETTETYHYRAWHERLHTVYYITVKLYKYGWFGIKYPVAKHTGKSPIEDGRTGIKQEQDRLKAEMLHTLQLTPA